MASLRVPTQQSSDRTRTGDPQRRADHAKSQARHLGRGNRAQTQVDGPLQLVAERGTKRAHRLRREYNQGNQHTPWPVERLSAAMGRDDGPSRGCRSAVGRARNRRVCIVFGGRDYPSAVRTELRRLHLTCVLHGLAQDWARYGCNGCKAKAKSA
jgi:hypothetical protein